MKVPSVFHSIRFRLSVLSSVVVFALGSAAVISLFFVIRHGLRKKLGEPAIVNTVPGRGYVLSEDPLPVPSS